MVDMDLLRAFGFSSIEDALGFSSIEGPAYADRVGGRLTFRDWEHWTANDQIEWRAEYELRRPKEDRA